MKTMIIGYSGCGKSTLAKYISELQNIECLYLDTVHWLPGWIEQKREEKEKILKSFLDTRKSWVIDGNYSAILYERRLKESDIIIFMNFNRFSCLYRAWKRFRKYKGTSRESMTDGCCEKMDREFAAWILYKGRNLKHRERYKRVQKEYGDKVITIRNQRQLEQYYKELDRQQNSQL